MQANASKRKQTKANKSKQKQTKANKRKQKKTNVIEIKKVIKIKILMYEMISIQSGIFG